MTVDVFLILVLVVGESVVVSVEVVEAVMVEVVVEESVTENHFCFLIPVQ